jgi:hypothetical protein
MENDNQNQDEENYEEKEENIQKEYMNDLDNEQNNENEQLEENNLQDQEEDNQENANNFQTEDNDIMYIYEWVDSIQLSRPKKNISRDFCDCVLLAEIIKHYIPRLVDLHNYPSVSNTKQKYINWNTFNEKVLKKIDLKLTKQEISDIITCKPFAIEKLLQRVYAAIESKTGINIRNGEGPKNYNFNKDNNSTNNNLRNQIEYYKNVLNEKEMSLQELKGIVEVLEMKLNSNLEMQNKLEEKINSLTEILKAKGVNI